MAHLFRGRLIVPALFAGLFLLAASSAARADWVADFKQAQQLYDSGNPADALPLFERALDGAERALPSTNKTLDRKSVV